MAARKKRVKRDKPKKAHEWEGQLREVLVEAVIRGHLQAVRESGKALLQHCKKITKVNSQQNAGFGKTKHSKTTGALELDFLLEDYTTPPKYSKRFKCSTHSPLMIAMELESMEVAKELIQLGASVAFKNKDGLTALHIACNHGMGDAVKLLLSTAQEQERFCKLKQKGRVEKGHDSDLEEIINAKERPQGWTPLMYAMKGGHEHILQQLVASKAIKYDINNRKQQNVCHVGARKGQLECLKLLHKSSGDAPFISQDKKGWNVIHEACCHGSEELMKWLLDTIPDLKSRDALNQESKKDPHRKKDHFPGAELCYTPLLVACLYNKFDIVRYLLDDAELRGLVDFSLCCHRKGERGTSALHLAAHYNEEDVARKLVDAGCPLKGKDVEGNTVLHVAIMMSSLSVSDFIRQDYKEAGLDTITNDKDQLPSEVEQEMVIPLEIKKQGKDAIEVYRKALAEGKEKIPYCGLLILGKEQVGKTSLFRQLVKLSFRSDLDSTRGIDNNTVDTVEKQPVGVERGGWEKKVESESSERFTDALANHIVPTLPPSKSAQSVQHEREVSQEELLERIQRIISEIDALQNPAATATSSHAAVGKPPAPPKQPVQHTTPPLSAQQLPKLAATSPKEFRRENGNQPTEKVPTPRPKQTIQPHTPAARRTADPAPSQQPPLPQPPATATAATAPEEPGDTTVPILRRVEGDKLNDIIRSGKENFTVKEPSLLFNTLDFAGQKLYRPMHYCFISRRALYVVVFKIPDMLKHISGAEAVPRGIDPVEELRYWIHSIHAHIYPDEVSKDKKSKDKDSKIHKVFLVGTHRGETTALDLAKIDRWLKEHLINNCDNDYCVDHVHRRPSSELKFFFPVENSIDFEKSAEKYLEESGTKQFQEEVEHKCEKLSFLKDDYPIKWLNFEHRLEHCTVARSLTPVMSIQEVRGMAVSSGIVGDDTQDVALKFLHDTGKIIYLKFLPKLFLKAAELKLLEEYVVLVPQWLMTVMQVIMELNTDKEEEKLTGKQVKRVEMTGIADIEILKVCWEKFISEENVGLLHLCLILQAYCLIFPIVPPDEDTASTDTPATDSSNAALSKPHERYIIPCKLPHAVKKEWPCHAKNCATFYFLFEQFLPVEIYHKLLCLALARAKRKRFHPPNCYSDTECRIYGLMETNWVLQMEQQKQRLKIMVMMREAEKPVEYIRYIHGFLCEICKESGCEGVEFHGGPEVKCVECKRIAILHCVMFPELSASNCCVQCHKEYDVDNKVLYSCAAEATLGINDLKDVLGAINDVAFKWEDLGIALDIKVPELRAIKKDNKDCVHDRLKAVVSSWLEGNGGECSWNFLCNALKHSLVDKPAIAEKIEQKDF